jgi:biopolymer transport protein ExbD
MSLYARPAQDDTMAEINVTPFTDVLLVLMIIFILLAALATPPGFQKSLAGHCGSGCGDVHPKHGSVDVANARDGRVYVGTRAVDESSIYGAPASVARRDAKTTVYLTGDRRVPYRLIVRALDAAKAAGLDDVSFVTR